MKNINKGFTDITVKINEKLIQDEKDFLDGIHHYMRNGISSLDGRNDMFIKGYGLAQKRFSLFFK